MGLVCDEQEKEQRRATATLVRMLLVAISMGDRDSKKMAHQLLTGDLERLLRTVTEGDPHFDREFVPYQLHTKEYFFDFPYVISCHGVATFAKHKDFGDNSHFAPVWIQLTLTEDMKILKQASIALDKSTPYLGEKLLIPIPNCNYGNKSEWPYQYEVKYSITSYLD